MPVRKKIMKQAQTEQPSRIPFAKQYLKPEQLLDKLGAAGMAMNRGTALHYLRNVGGYRLKGYWFHLWDFESRRLQPDAHFDQVIARYEFDRALRHITYEALEVIEIAVRSLLSNYMSEKHGPHWFMKNELFKHQEDSGNSGQPRFNPILEKVRQEVAQAHRRPYVKHYLEKYSAPPMPPSWATSECLAFGTWSKTFRLLLNSTHRHEISLLFNIETAMVFESWLHALSVLRNTVAHHGRLLRMRADVAPMAYRRKRLTFSNPRTFFTVATITNYMLDNLGFSDQWPTNLARLFRQFPQIDPPELGFPAEWNMENGWIREDNLRHVSPPQLMHAQISGATTSRKKRRNARMASARQIGPTASE